MGSFRRNAEAFKGKAVVRECDDDLMPYKLTGCAKEFCRPASVEGYELWGSPALIRCEMARRSMASSYNLILCSLFAC